MTREQQEFDYYCLDRLKPTNEDIKITYNNAGVIKTIYYKIGLIATIKHIECVILYTESDNDLDEFIYMTREDFYKYEEKFYTEIFEKEDIEEIITKIKTINIFEFTSLLNFIFIFEEFREFILHNWEILNMDNLIEI